jgi:predicted metal-dependent phosphoesterase TrpH
MRLYRADMHIHTLLSPCGDLDMTPANIVARAKERKLDIIGITDHNTTRQCNLVAELASEKGLFVMCGAEVTTSEEVHCLAFFKSNVQLSLFQNYLDDHLPNIKNDPKYFGYQVAVDRKEDIVFEEERLLLSALDQSVEQVADKVKELGGIFFPAHIDKTKNSIISQLGFFPKGLSFDAVGVSKFADLEKLKSNNKILTEKSIVRSSDSHYLENIGDVYTEFSIERPDFDEIAKALRGEEGREVIVK